MSIEITQDAAPDRKDLQPTPAPDSTVGTLGDDERPKEIDTSN